MNSPLFTHLFTAVEKEMISSLLISVSKKDQRGQPLKLSYFNSLEELLGIPVLAKFVSNDSRIDLDLSIAITTITDWDEDKKTLLKGLVIDLLCYNDKLIKEECEAVQKVYTAIGIYDIEFNRIVQSKHFNP